VTTAPVALVVLTYNSEADLDRCLASAAGWVGEAFIVDSFSEDATAEIAKRHGAQVHTHRFEGFAAQRNWALQNLPFSYEWVFFLDADEEVLPELRDEILALFRRGEPRESGFFVPRRFVWMGRWLRHGGYYPASELQLFRHRRCRVIDAGLREYNAIEGEVGALRHDLVHEARKGLGYWIQKHVMYAGLEADEQVTGAGAARLREAQRPGVYLEGTSRNRIRERVWNRIPLFVRPLVLFGYRYVFRLGFLDGVPGLVYCFLHEIWYQFLIDLRVWELRRGLRR
jgi:glycosyltransferase involved in cell wall biosynthesis